MRVSFSVSKGSRIYVLKAWKPPVRVSSGHVTALKHPVRLKPGPEWQQPGSLAGQGRRAPQDRGASSRSAPSAHLFIPPCQASVQLVYGCSRAAVKHGFNESCFCVTLKIWPLYLETGLRKASGCQTLWSCLNTGRTCQHSEDVWPPCCRHTSITAPPGDTFKLKSASSETRSAFRSSGQTLRSQWCN